MNRRLLAGLMLALALLVSSAPALQAQTADENIVEIAAASEDFSTLVAAVQAAGLADVLAGRRPLHRLCPD